MSSFVCPYQGCSYTTNKKQYMDSHTEGATQHCYPGLMFRLTCSAKGGCQNPLYTKAFEKEDVENYLDPDKPKVIRCIACTKKEKERKRIPAKRKRLSKTCAVKKMLEFAQTHAAGDPFLAGVTRAELVEYFAEKTDNELEEMDTENVILAKSVVGLAQIYTRSEDGGGAGVHASVRRFWHDLVTFSRCFSRANPSSHNGFFSAFAQFRLMYDRYEGAPAEFDEFQKQSLAIKRLGKPLLGKRGDDHYVLLVHSF